MYKASAHKETNELKLLNFTHLMSIYESNYYNFKYQNNKSMSTFSIKPHLIFYIYNDAKLLEVKSLKENRAFENSIQDKIRLNLNLFYWIKSYDNQ